MSHDDARHALPPGFRWPDGIRAAALFSFDLDAESVMLGDHPEVGRYLDVIAHQRYGPKVAVPRILRMLDRLGLRTTFFVPGWVAETWPDVVRTVRDFRYDSAMMDSDHPYRLATSAEPGSPTLIELPVHWSLDDWNRYNYVPGFTSNSPIGRPSEVCAAWAEELDAIVEVGGLYSLTMHPFISGRPARADALEELIERAAAIDGLWLATGEELAAWVETLDLPPVLHEPPVIRP